MTQYTEQPELLEPIGSIDDLVGLFRSGEKPREAFRIGTEHEKIGLHEATLRPIPYEGEGGIEALLERLAEEHEMTRVQEAGRTIALKQGKASLTLEPGGQLELSGAPLETIHETCKEFHDHLELLRPHAEALGIVWLGLGIHPFHGVDEIPRMPKARYDVMRSYLPTRGGLALDMMHCTATVQVNLDFTDEADMARKMRVGLALTPIISSVFANSSLAAGKDSGFASRRLNIWRDTDPDRTGPLPFAQVEGFGYRDYVEWALDAPVFFILRGERMLPLGRKTFRRFMAEGHEGEHATLADFDLHLTTVFPDVRLKRFIEVRGADAVPPGLTCSLPALWKGLYYDPSALDAAFEMVRPWTPAQVEAGLDDVARRGLAAELAGRPVAEWLNEVTDLAAEGLRQIDDQNASGEDERRFLEPVREQLALGKSPGEAVIERWEGEWRRSPERLIDYARY
ncbi:MAG: glutamate--cysteine ligase [Deltaproteobacteria bacterium]|nr:glutamate--cysteine ligase [Deltaproteobacteria bacterium]MBW2446846.1 glutamate--cysteine ligase [Deltaproteobacteria bacterium]